MTISVSSPRVLIVNCNVNDEEIEGLTTSIVNAETAKGHICTRVDFETMDRQTAHFDKLILVSHHGFYDPNQKVRLLKDRTIGQYPVEEVSRKLCTAIRKSNVSEVQFFGCEIALHRSNRNWDFSHDVFQITFNKQKYMSVNKRLKKSDDAEISTLAYMAKSVYDLLENMLLNNNIKKTVVLRGLTGVGYIDPANPIPKSFDRNGLAELNAIRSIRRELERATNPQKIAELKRKLKVMENDFNHNYIEQFKPPIQYELRVKADYI